MQENDPQNTAFRWSTAFVRELYASGVRHAVMSPGSRSTPLTLAFAAHPGFNKHVIIDERSAAFTALGIGKATGVPAVLVCTSGTAVANYMPAVVEATQSGVPMIVASADRPPKYRDIGASQSMDQLKLFGSYPIFFHEVGEPVGETSNIRRLELAARQALDLSIQKGGVAHLNFAFSKPFEPHQKYLEQAEKENSEQIDTGSKSGHPVTGKTKLNETLWSDIVAAERPVIIVGLLNFTALGEAIFELAERLKAPVLAEPGSGLPESPHSLQGFDGFLRNDDNQKALAPDLILRFGNHPVSKALQQYLETHAESEQIVFLSPNRWEDGSLTGHKHISLPSAPLIPEIQGAADQNWFESWKKAEKLFHKKRKELVNTGNVLTDGYVFSSLSKLIPEKAFTMLSNSFPARDMSLFGEFSGKKMYLNRGAAGIDGITSTAFGISKASQKPGVLFTGDIAFLHDSNALAFAKEIEQPLVIVLINNGGGTIFRMLPVHQIKQKYERYFETPQTVKFAALCRAHEVSHTPISKPEQLVPAFEQQITKPGVHVIECLTNADSSMKQRHLLWNFKLNSDSE